MDNLSLKASKRTVMRKKTRFLRRQGITPIHLFGRDMESLALQCDTTQLKHIVDRAGTTRPISLIVDKEKGPKTVFIREIQQDIISRLLVHVDLYQVRKGETIKVDVPLVFVGEAPAMKGKGRILTRGLDILSVECLPEDLPPQIEVDLSPLTELGQSIFVKNITLKPEIKVYTDPEQMVVKVSEIIVREEEPVKPAVAEVPAAGEVPAEGEAAAGEAPAAETPTGESAPPRKGKP